jgi:3-oxoacyl-[acyl-carrier protein] reductase
MEQLEGKVALVAGGTGEVGEGVVRAFLRRGATVVVPSRSGENLERLRDLLGPLAGERFVPVVGNIGRPEGARKIREHVHGRFGRLDAMVAALGGYWYGEPLVRLSFETWQRLMDDNLNSHFVAARTFLPMMLGRGKGTYVLIGGRGAEFPTPLSGPPSIAGAAEIMLTRVLMEELKGTGVRVREVMPATPVMTRSRGGRGRADWITGDEFGAFLAWFVSDEGAISPLPAEVKENGAVLYASKPQSET